jgi:hypothetical protein
MVRSNASVGSTWKARGSQVEVRDCLFLGLVMLLSCILYINDLGFYGDDWAFLRIFYLSENQSLVGLIRSTFETSNIWSSPPLRTWAPRPVQAIYEVSLYWLFGLNPFGYHLVNTTVLTSGIIGFYWVVRELTGNRMLAIVVPMTYGLLPHYSTDRLWYAAFQANLSMVLYFLSLFCDLQQLKAKRNSLYAWKTLSLVSLIGSTLAYEVFIPLFWLNPFMVLYQKRRLQKSGVNTQLSRRTLTLLLASNIVVLTLILIFKALVSEPERAPTFSFSLIKWLSQQSLTASIDLSFGDYGTGLPRIIWKIVSTSQNMAVFVLTSALAIFVCWYLSAALRQSAAQVPRRSTMLILVFVGLLIAGLSYCYFYDYFKITTGINNRVAIAASVGVALCLVGVAGWIARFVSSSYTANRVFCLAIGLLTGSGFLINNTIASYWVAAYKKQQAILHDTRAQFPTLPKGSTLILDGFCPYVGPGIVFEMNWDVTGALGVMYRDGSLRGDVVKPWLQVTQGGISLDGNSIAYPYDSLFVYNVRRNTGYRLKNADVAREYFSMFTPDHNSECPSEYTGYDYGVGLRIF